MTVFRTVVLFAFTIAVQACEGQIISPGTPSPLPLREVTVDLAGVRPLAGLPALTVLGYPQHCSADGSLYLEAYADQSGGEVSYFPRLYRVDSLGGVRQLVYKMPENFKQFMSLSFFARNRSVALLLQAFSPKVADEPAGKKYFFLSTIDVDGSHAEVRKLELPFVPRKLAQFASDDLLVLGSDTVNLQPVLAVLDHDGSLKKMLDLDGAGYQRASKKLRDQEAQNDPSEHMRATELNALLGNAQFVTWGDTILLVQPGASSDVRMFRNPGEGVPQKVTLPAGFGIETILDSGGRDTWIVRAQQREEERNFAKTHIAENAPKQLFEVDPATGKAKARISLTGTQAAAVGCAAQSKLAAVFFGDPANPDQLTYSVAPR